jgi:hypothetical protein
VARIVRDEIITIRPDGIVDETWIATPDGEFTLPFISCGALDLRALGWQGYDSTNLYVVEADNWRWPIWWVLLRLWRFARWFEHNLRLTAHIWSLLKCDIGCEPRWRDFILLWWIRQWRRPKVFKIEMLYDLLGKTWPPQQT